MFYNISSVPITFFSDFTTKYSETSAALVISSDFKTIHYILKMSFLWTNPPSFLTNTWSLLQLLVTHDIHPIFSCQIVQAPLLDRSAFIFPTEYEHNDTVRNNTNIHHYSNYNQTPPYNGTNYLHPIPTSTLLTNNH